jgi:GDP-L-fucose synthase
MKTTDRIFVAGHRGLVGSAIVRRLAAGGFDNVLGQSHAELDLCRQDAAERFFDKERPSYVFLAAGRVGGILANNTYPADFIRDNLLIQTNVIDAAYRTGVKKLLLLGSSCIYPKHAPQPIKEEYLLTGQLEPTNQAYAVAKIAGVEMIRSYRRQLGFPGIAVMPTNLYGPNDNFDPETSHVLAALMRRFHEARRTDSSEVEVWGTGRARREFLHVDDLADACVFLMDRYDGEHVLNIGVGEDVTIRELAELLKRVTDYRGRLRFDETKPDGTPRKLLDVTRLHALGWRAQIPLERGVEQTYAWYARDVAASGPELTGTREPDHGYSR